MADAQARDELLKQKEQKSELDQESSSEEGAEKIKELQDQVEGQRVESLKEQMKLSTALAEA